MSCTTRARDSTRISFHWGLRSLRHLSPPPDLLSDFNDSGWTISAPLGALLPPSLVAVELGLIRSPWRLDDFLQATGLPRSLTQISNRIPSSRQIHFSGMHWGDAKVAREAMEQMRRIETGIALLVFSVGESFKLKWTRAWYPKRGGAFSISPRSGLRMVYTQYF